MRVKHKLMIAAVVGLLVVPATTQAFSLDDLVKSYISHLKEKIATLEKENAQLKEQLASGSCASAKKISSVAPTASSSKKTERPTVTEIPATVSIKKTGLDEEGENVHISVTGPFQKMYMKMWSPSGDLIVGTGYSEYPSGFSLDLNALNEYGVYTWEVGVKIGTVETIKKGEFVLEK